MSDAHDTADHGRHDGGSSTGWRRPGVSRSASRDTVDDDTASSPRPPRTSSLHHHAANRYRSRRRSPAEHTTPAALAHHSPHLSAHPDCSAPREAVRRPRRDSSTSTAASSDGLRLERDEARYRHRNVDYRFMAGLQRDRYLDDGELPFLLPGQGQQRRHPAAQRRPLVDFVTNDWRRQRHDDLYSSDDDDFLFAEKDSCLEPVWDSVVDAVGKVPRRLQRMSLMLLCFLFAMWLGWQYFLWPMYREQQGLAASVVAPQTEGHYGANMRPLFNDMVQVKTMDSSLLPGATIDRKRLVFVGDVHGCKEELTQLLAKISFKPANDHLILTGDIIAKGPDSPGVVDLVRSLGASCVRGNHEDRVLLAHRAMSQAASSPPSPPTADTKAKAKPSTENDTMTTTTASKHALLASLLSDQQLDWLAQCPVILRVGPIPGMGTVLVVHAGLVPGIDLERHDPYMAMNMRSVDLETKVPSEGRDGMGWERLWNAWQERVGEWEGQTVVYGHDSKRGLNLERWSKGLDSGCVGGGRLSALVVEAVEGEEVVRQEVVSVGCGEGTRGWVERFGKKKGEAKKEKKEGRKEEKREKKDEKEKKQEKRDKKKT